MVELLISQVLEVCVGQDPLMGARPEEQDTAILKMMENYWRPMENQWTPEKNNDKHWKTDENQLENNDIE